jgi:hypothetical protein
VTGAERAARARRVREARQPAEPAAPVPDDPQVPPARLGGYVRTDPVRSTVDLPPAHHAKLAEKQDEWSIEFGLPPGRRGVTRQAVLAAAVAELLVDATIAGRVKARLAREYGSQ